MKNLDFNTNQSIKNRKQISKNQLVKKAVKMLILAIGDNPNREDIKETPNRVARMYQEIFSSQTLSDFSDYKVFQSQKNNTDMVLVKNIPFYSMCEHHLLPFFGKANVAYIPKNGRIIGISKIPRLIDFVCHRLSLQEKVTFDIANLLQKNLSPGGVAVLTSARHMCVEMRGIKKTGSKTEASCFTGDFKTDLDKKKEFFSRIKN